MKQSIAILWAESRPLVLAFAACALLAIGFGANAVAKWVYWHDPAHQNQTVAGWMTPRYVSHSWKLPPGYLRPIVAPNAQERPPKGQSLTEIAAEQARPLDDLITEINTAITAHLSQAND